MNQENKQAGGVALVTGAARRIGETIVRHLHQSGFDVVIHCHQSLNCANILADELNAQRPFSACVLTADLRNEDEARGLIKTCVQWKRRLDLLVNNASAFIKTSADKALWDELLSLNVKAPFWLSEEAFDALKAHEGSIINITDIHAEKPLKSYSMYCQTKAALKMQTESLARDYAPYVRVNAVAPGAILWPEKNNQLSDEMKQQIIKETPLKRHGAPHWIANAVCFLVENHFITGQTVRVDGGRSLI